MEYAYIRIKYNRRVNDHPPTGASGVRAATLLTLSVIVVN